MPTAPCTQEIPWQPLRGLPLSTQRHVCSKPKGVGHVLLFQGWLAGALQWHPGLASVLPLPASWPWWKRQDGAFSAPWCRAGRTQLLSPGRWQQEKKRQERLEKCAGLHIQKGWRQNIHWGSHGPGQGEVLQEREAPLPSLQSPHCVSPQWGKKASTTGPVLSPLSPLSVLSPFPKERRLPPACHGAATLCCPARTLLLGDLCTGRHQRPLSRACQEQSSSPHPPGCEQATEEETRITNSLTPCPAEAGGPPAATASPGRGSPEGARGTACTTRTGPQLLPRSHQRCHCPCSDPLLTSSLRLSRAAAPLARPAARGCRRWEPWPSCLPGGAGLSQSSALPAVTTQRPFPSPGRPPLQEMSFFNSIWDLFPP